MRRMFATIVFLAAISVHMPSAFSAESEQIEKVSSCGDYTRAYELTYAEYIRLGQDGHADKHRILNVLRQLTRLAVVLNELELATAYANQSLELAEAGAVRHQLDIAEIQHELARLHHTRGMLEPAPDRSCSQFAQAEHHFNKELDLRSNVFGTESLHHVHNWHELSSNYAARHRFEAAYQDKQREFQLLCTLHGENHFGMASTYMDLAALESRVNRFALAIAHYEKAIALLEAANANANCLMIRDAKSNLNIVRCRMEALQTTL